MSFILDALNRSHAEREQQRAPAQAQSSLDLLKQSPTNSTPVRSAWLVPALGGAAAALVVALAATAWLNRTDTASTPAEADVVQPTTASAPKLKTLPTKDAGTAGSAATAANGNDAPASAGASATAEVTNSRTAAAAGTSPATRSAPARASIPAPSNAPSPGDARAAAEAPGVPEWAQETGPDDDAEALLSAVSETRRARPTARAAGTRAAPAPQTQAQVQAQTETQADREPAAGSRRSAASESPNRTTPPESAPREREPARRASVVPAEAEDALAGIPRLTTLDPGFRESLPRYQINALVYSDEPAERLVVLDLARYREGDRTRDGATVAAIARKGVVLDKSGKRFVVTTQ